MIQSIRIQNYKALRDVTLKLTPVHVLIGPNDTGKTSILEAVTAICRSVDHELASAFLGRWEGRELVWKDSAENTITFDLDVQNESESANYHMACTCLPFQRQAIIQKEVARMKGVEYVMTAAGHTDSAVRRFLTNPSQRTAPPEVLQFIHQSLTHVRNCRWSPGMLALPVAFEGHGNQFALSSSGFGLALLLDDILGDNRDRYIEMENRFRSIFPQIESVKLHREPGFKVPPNDRENVPILQHGSGKGIRFDFINGNSGVPASQVSDGLLIVLGYLAMLFSPRPPRMLLVEEPENGIHPARLNDVIGLLREIVADQSHTQLLLTTHSPYVVDHFKPDEVTLCRKQPNGSVSVHRLSDSRTVKEQIDLFTLGEIWTGEGDDALAGAAPKVEGTAP